MVSQAHSDKPGSLGKKKLAETSREHEIARLHMSVVLN
jgi:hypothetical protein